MTIASEITRIKTNIESAYTALEAKGATIPSEKNSANLASTVNSIIGGGSSGETNYLGRIVTEDGILQYPTESFTFSLPSNVTSIGDYGLNYTFYGCTSLTSVDLSNVTSIGSFGLSDAFESCTSLTSTGLDNVTSIGDYGLNYTFYGCTSLTSVDLSNVTSIGDGGLSSAFRRCTSLTSLSFPKLNSNSFGSYTNQFNNMLRGVTGCTVHFPSNLESVIGSWSSVTNGFGGTDTVILFDLPLTETSGDGTGGGGNPGYGGGGYGDGGYS